MMGRAGVTTVHFGLLTFCAEAMATQPANGRCQGSVHEQQARGRGRDPSRQDDSGRWPILGPASKHIVGSAIYLVLTYMLCLSCLSCLSCLLTKHQQPLSHSLGGGPPAEQRHGHLSDRARPRPRC